MSGLYDRALLAYAARELPPLPRDATHRATRQSPLCGDQVTVAVRLEGGRIAALGAVIDACAICRASTAWMCAILEGASLDGLAAYVAALESTMRGEHEPSGDLAMFAGLTLHPSRHGCALLPWQALEHAWLHAPAERAAPPRAPLVGNDAWEVLAQLRARNERAAMATLVSVVGSSPCPVGSRMVVAADGAYWGSVSGGCVESAVVRACLRVLAGEPPHLASFQIANSAAGEAELACGGQIRVHVARAPDGEITVSEHEARILDLGTGTLRTHALQELEGPLRDAAARAGALERGVLSEDETAFVEVPRPPPRLVMIGGTHIAQKLAALACEVGLHPVLVDPRSALASDARFAGVERVVASPRDALPALLGPRSALVTLTHDPRLDDPALAIALTSEAFYVGALGSRKTQRARLERLRALGLREASLARLRGPAGVPIGGVGAGEIALSILAEVVATLRTPARAPRIAGVLLAAGSSRRAGPVNKLLFDVDGEPMVRRTARALREAGVERLVVVLGHEADRVREALVGLDAELVENPAHAEGMGSSLACGIAALGSDTDAALVALGDMPFVRATDVRRVLDAHRPSTAHLVIAPCVHQGTTTRRGHPVLWPRRYFDALRALRGDEGGRQILRDAPGAVLEIPVDDDGVLRDVDTLDEASGAIAEARS